MYSDREREIIEQLAGLTIVQIAEAYFKDREVRMAILSLEKPFPRWVPRLVQKFIEPDFMPLAREEKKAGDQDEDKSKYGKQLKLFE